MAFTGDIALITGGGSGMGQSWARQLAEQGATVVLFDVNDEGMAATASGLPSVHAMHVDLTDTCAVETAVQQVESDLGPIDRVVNAAAIMPFGRLLEQPAATQLKIMEVNYGGLVNIATATLPAMMGRGRGDFVSFSSMSGLIPGLLMGGYCSSKSAVQTYTEILYHENLNSGIRFCCVCPPAVATPLWKQAEATVVPKLPGEGETLTPKDVIDEVENCLERGQFVAYPGKQTAFGARMRRFFPGLIWKQAHKVEGF